MKLFVCSAGGIELTAQHGRIKINNTLESRLDMISQQVSFQFLSVCDPYNKM